MKIKRYYLIPALLLVSSCNHQGIIDDAPVEVCKPEKVVSVDIDTTLHCTFPEVLNAFMIQIVKDSILVFQEQRTSVNNPYHFKAYSTNNFKYLGEFIRNGRGPGEVLSPYFVRSNSSEEYLSMSMDSSEKTYSVDVEKTLESGNPAIVRSFDLPSGTIGCLPLTGDRLFTLQSEERHFTIKVLDGNGKTLNTFNFSHDISDENYLTYLSSILTRNGKSGKVAEIMIFFPQINIFDTDNGAVRSFAVSRAYRNWKSVISRQINLETTTQYYADAATGTDYIFAAYKDVPLEQIIKGGGGTSIHVFDWDGNFKYDIKVREDINYMTFDGRTKKLYCIEKQEGKIIRYDLSGLL